MTTPTDLSPPRTKIETDRTFILQPGSENIFYKFDGLTLFVNCALGKENRIMVECDLMACRCGEEGLCILRDPSYEEAIHYVDVGPVFPPLKLAI
jgi:hypothetical protein